MNIDRAIVQAALEALESVDCSTGYCCCGSVLEEHGTPSDHYPVDAGAYQQGNLIIALRAALAAEPATSHGLTSCAGCGAPVGDQHMPNCPLAVGRAIRAHESAEPAPAEPVAPYCYVYEFDSPFGIHQSLSPREYNGSRPARTVPVYTAPPAPAPAEPAAWMSEPVVLPDGSAFAVASWPLPKDHWLYAPRGEWDNVRDEYAECPAPILNNSHKQAVMAAIKYAVRSTTMCGQEMDFDPDAMVQNAVYALCGPAYATVLPVDAPPAPALVPLTEAQLTAAVLADETLRYYFALNGGAGPVSNKGVKVFRAVERAHGIGGKA